MKVMLAAMVLLIIAASIGGVARGSQAQREVYASEVLEKIARGEDVIYDNVTISEGLEVYRYLTNFSRPSEDYGRETVASTVRITNSSIAGNVSFINCIFGKQVDFSGTTFRKNANFDNAKFADIAFFTDSKFLGYAYLSWTQFENWVDFSGAVFSKGISFYAVRFNSDSSFEKAVFTGPADFTLGVFKGYTYFNNAEFDDCANFYLDQFYEETHLEGSRFLGYANFNDSRYWDYTYLSGASFTGPLSLNRTKITDWAMDWRSIDGHLVYNDAAYQALMQKLWTSGNFDDYDDCYFQYRWLKQSFKPMGISKALDLFAWALCGYGVRPLRTLAFGFTIVIFFGILYWRAKLVPRFHIAKPSDSRNQQESVIQALEEAMYFSAMMFLTRPPYGLHPAGRWKYLIIIEYISGWLIMALFLVILGRLMIR